MLGQKQTQGGVDGMVDHEVAGLVTSEVDLGQEISLVPAHQVAALVWRGDSLYDSFMTAYLVWRGGGGAGERGQAGQQRGAEVVD